MKPLAAVGLNGLVVLITGLVVSLPAPSLAGTFVTFGPQDYVRPPGAPVTETRSFTVRNPSTSYTLRIHNGGLVDGEFEQVANSVITLNGVQIVGPNEFNHSTTLLEQPIVPAATNELAVQLRGQPGGGVTIQILGVDTDLPVITAAVDRPPNVAGWYTADVTVSFTCSDATSGIASCPAPAVVSAGGANQVISGTAIDQAGNQATATATVSLDKTPPVVALTSPPNLSLFRTPSVAVSGTVDDPGTTVLVNGVPAAAGGGTFTAPAVLLREGRNVLTATATDPAGNVGTSSITVTLDTTPPTVRIDAPTNGAVVTGSQVTVTGMINDVVSGTVNAEQAIVTVNGVRATLSNRSFVVPNLPLVRGPNTIMAVARDRAGNESQTQIQVTFQQVIGQQRIEMVSGNNQSGLMGTTLPEPLAARLVDAEGRPMAGRPVTFTVIRTDGLVRASLEERRAFTVLTDDLGEARVFWRLGTRTGAGNNQVSATSAGFVGEVMFCASATVGVPARITVVSGETQRGRVSAPLPLPLVAMVVDAGGNPVGGVPVTFTVEHGGGTLDGTPATTVTKPADGDGKAAALLTLGEQEGINNQVVTAGFEGLTGARATFLASGVVPGPPQDTRVSGVVLDNADRPIPNATAKIVGTALSAVTGAQGQFTIPGAPVGTLTLIVDGSTSTRPESFPFLAFVMTTIAGQDNTIGMPVFLPALDAGNSRIVGGDEEVVLTMTGVPGVAFTVFPLSATFPDGSKVGRLTLTQVHADKVPMPPPNGTTPRVVWTLQPAGVHFDPPIRVQLPNTEGLPPGQVVEVAQFDHDLEQFVSMGAARVSEDGSVIVSDPGFGVTKAGWGAVLPPPPPTTQPENDACKNAANDAQKLADDAHTFLNPTIIFAKTQACIAKTACENKQNLDQPDWLDKVMPRFIAPYRDLTGLWPGVFVLCHSISILNPAREELCAAFMALYHINIDLKAALIATASEMPVNSDRCGAPGDWTKTEKIVKSCIDQNSLPLVSGAAQWIAVSMRERVRKECLAIFPSPQ